jgi:dipeptidyl aminopeptidase/acylaminoacyl peptidase
MQTRLFGAIVVVLLTALLGNAHKRTDSSQIQKLSSPDGKIVAFIRSTKAQEATPESRVELRSESGRVLARRNYRSADGEHGYGVTKASWTPDSQFFVYSLESSGGHQAWHAPVLFFSRRDNKVVSLDHLLKDSVSNPQFVVSAPDRVTVELEFSKQTKTVSLNQLRKP